MKARVKIEMEIEFDELQYENDGFIGLTNVKEAFEELFPFQENVAGYDFEYKWIDKPQVTVVKIDKE